MKDPSGCAGWGVAVAAAEGSDAVMGGASGRVGGTADERGDLRVRHAGHVVVGNRLSLFGRERAERRPQAVVRCFSGVGCGPGLSDVGNRSRPAALGADDVNRLVVRNCDKPSLHVGAVREVWIGPQGGEKGLRPASSESGRASTARHTRSTVGPCSATISSNGRFIVINL